MSCSTGSNGQRRFAHHIHTPAMTRAAARSPTIRAMSAVSRSCLSPKKGKGSVPATGRRRPHRRGCRTHGGAVCGAAARNVMAYAELAAPRSTPAATTVRKEAGIAGHCVQAPPYKKASFSFPDRAFVVWGAKNSVLRRSFGPAFQYAACHQK